MSLGPALQVPLGAPRTRGGPFGDGVLGGAVVADEEDDGWGDARPCSASMAAAPSAAWLHSTDAATGAEPGCTAEARVAVGYADGSVHVFSRRVRRTSRPDAACAASSKHATATPPPSRASTATPGPQGRTHAFPPLSLDRIQRHTRAVSASGRSADAVQSPAQSASSIGTSGVSSPPSALMHSSTHASRLSPSGASALVSTARASATQPSETPYAVPTHSHAEPLLEQQYNATDAPLVYGGPDDTHAQPVHAVPRIVCAGLQGKDETSGGTRGYPRDLQPQRESTGEQRGVLPPCVQESPSLVHPHGSLPDRGESTATGAQVSASGPSADGDALGSSTDRGAHPELDGGRDPGLDRGWGPGLDGGLDAAAPAGAHPAGAPPPPSPAAQPPSPPADPPGDAAVPCRVLFSPDASRVLGVIADEGSDSSVTGSAPRTPQLVVHQASGRITAWALDTLHYLGSVFVRVTQTGDGEGPNEVQFLFEHQGHTASSSMRVYGHLARLAHSEARDAIVRVLHVEGAEGAGADEAIPAFVWLVLPPWPQRVFILRTDVVLQTFTLCAVLAVPHDTDPRRWQLAASLGTVPELALYVADEAGAVARVSYLLPDWRAFCGGTLTHDSGVETPKPTPEGGSSPGNGSGAAPRALIKSLSQMLPVWHVSLAHDADHAPPQPPRFSSKTLRCDADEAWPPLALLVARSGGDAAAPPGHRAYALVDLCVDGDMGLVGVRVDAADTSTSLLLLVDATDPGDTVPSLIRLPSAVRCVRASSAPRTALVFCLDHVVSVRLAWSRAGSARAPTGCVVSVCASRSPWAVVAPEDGGMVALAQGPGSVAAALPETAAGLLEAEAQPSAATAKPPDALAAGKPDDGSVTALVPLAIGRIILALAHGGLAAATLPSLYTTDAQAPVHADASLLRWAGGMELLQLVVNPRTGTKHVVGGSSHGSIAVWDVASLQVEAEWTWFAAPVQTIVPLVGVSPLSRLYGCVLCVATDGTSALLSLDDLRLCVARGAALTHSVYLFPGAGRPLVHVAVRADDMLLVYGEDRARIWSLASHELVRSVTAEQVWLLVAQPVDGEDPWIRLAVPPNPHSAGKAGVGGMLSPSGCAQAAAISVLLADVPRAVENASRTLRGALGVASLLPVFEPLARHMGGAAGAAGASPPTAEDARLQPGASPPTAEYTRPQPEAPGASPPTTEYARLQPGDPAGQKLLSTLRPLFQLFVPLGLDATVDALTAGVLGDDLPAARTHPLVLEPGCYAFPGFLSVAPVSDVHERFAIAPCATSQHLLAALSLALLAGTVEPLHGASMAVVHTLLSPPLMERAVGRAWMRPALSTLASFVLCENETMRTAASLLFRHYMRSAPSAELARLIATWAPYIGTEASVGAHDLLQAHAVLLLGLVASERYAYFSPALLKQLSHMVAQYLALAPTQGSTFPAYVALELVCCGCDVWQHYVDAIALVRGVFALATESEEGLRSAADGGAWKLTGQSLRSHARRATLELAAAHSALFMSTLAMDILHAPSVEQSQVTLKLVAFMIRQKPLALYTSLPRLVEAVVKSLDPNVATVRANMVKAATVMINELVHTYPSIAFHAGSQRLAVGTPDGHVVLYDLKTATRLYVLGGHAHPVTACSFSPDGRRFLSMSLADQCVLQWRLSTGLLDMFVPGTMSRLAGSHGQAAASRTIHFHLGSAAALRPADVLTQVSFAWPSDRTVRLRVGEAYVNLGIS
ncbi:hypothetical protein MSPP1_001705 [Malassezia sp. CBS 17886]|nr:hypothetical protein MSPP1_001705 [Malassezia sp. CBS 17886]